VTKQRQKNPDRLKKQLRGRKHCQRCGVTWDRDITAALSIMKIFRYQRQHQTLDRPAAYRR